MRREPECRARSRRAGLTSTMAAGSLTAPDRCLGRGMCRRQAGPRGDADVGHGVVAAVATFRLRVGPARLMRPKGKDRARGALRARSVRCTRPVFRAGSPSSLRRGCLLRDRCRSWHVGDSFRDTVSQTRKSSSPHRTAPGSFSDEVRRSGSSSRPPFSRLDHAMAYLFLAGDAQRRRPGARRHEPRSGRRRVLTRGLVQRFDARRDTRSYRLGERESPNAAGPSVDGASRSRTGDLLLANPIAAVAIAFGLRRCRTNRPQTRPSLLRPGCPCCRMLRYVASSRRSRNDRSQPRRECGLVRQRRATRTRRPDIPRGTLTLDQPAGKRASRTISSSSRTFSAPISPR